MEHHRWCKVPYQWEIPMKGEKEMQGKPRESAGKCESLHLQPPWVTMQMTGQKTVVWRQSSPGPARRCPGFHTSEVRRNAPSCDVCSCSRNPQLQASLVAVILTSYGFGFGHWRNATCSVTLPLAGKPHNVCTQICSESLHLLRGTRGGTDTKHLRFLRVQEVLFALGPPLGIFRAKRLE